MIILILIQFLFGIFASNFVDFKTQSFVFYGIIFSCFIPYLLMYRIISRKPKFLLRFIIISTIFLGLSFISVSPSVDHDIYVYKWQGYLLNLNINPYSHPPEHYSNSQISKNFPFWGDMQFKEFRPLYPPLSEIVFGLDYKLFGFSILGTKLFFLGFLSLTVYILGLIMKYFGKSIGNLWLFAGNPLVLYEIVGAVHNDIVMIFLMVFSIFLILKKKYKISAIFYALAIGAKFIPIFLLPLILKKIKKPWQFLVILAATLIFLYLPFLLTTKPSNLIETLKVYSVRWTYAPGIFAFVQTVLFHIGIQNSFNITKVFFWVGLLGLTFFVFKNNNKSFDTIIQSSAVIIGYILIANSVLFPWYTIWILIFVPFLKNPLPWIVLSCTCLFIPLMGYGEEGRQLWRQLIVWLPVFLSFLIVWKNKKYQL